MMDDFATAWSVATWATAGCSWRRIPSSPAAVGPGTPGSSETAAVGFATHAGEGVQSGWVKSRICPSVVGEMAAPAGGVFTLSVMITA